MDFEGMTIDELVSTLASLNSGERDGALAELKDRGRETEEGDPREAFLKEIAEAQKCHGDLPEVTFRLTSMTLYLEAIWPPYDERRYLQGELAATQASRETWLATLQNLDPKDPKRPGVEKYLEFYLSDEVKWLTEQIRELDQQLWPYGMDPVAP